MGHEYGLGSVLFAVVLCSASAFGQVWEPGAWVPGVGESMPHYWTGTNAVAKGTVRSSLQDYIVEPELIVGGTEVKRFDYIPGEPQTSTVSLPAVIDSTHFPDGMFVQVEVFGWSQSG